ncbi:MAG: 4-hydroxy-tetrahydrodipicolinate synthase [Clostridia bacterium]|nr:4-hydroxy-tetrahydrodipicolinate synthase [Clostridia bacterium]
MLNIKGSIVALVTPFNVDGSVDYGRLKELVDWHIAEGTDGIVALGTTAETPTLTADECHKIVEVVISTADHRIPVIAGSGSNSTQAMLEKSLIYEQMGADGLLVISPYYNKANAEGMYRHFATVADAVHTPLILYNVPSRTGCAIPVPVVEKLAKHPNVAAIKEASGDLSYATAVARYVGDDFAMYSGNDDVVIPILSLGGSGVISVWANVAPKTVHQMVADYFSGHPAAALDCQLRNYDFIKALFCEVNPIPVKTAMNLAGHPVGGFRLPLYDMSAPAVEKLTGAMKEVGLL